MAFSRSRSIRFVSNRFLRVKQWTITNVEASNLLPRNKQLVKSSTATFDYGRNQQIQIAWNKHGFRTNCLAVMNHARTDFGLRGAQKYLIKRALSVRSQVFAQETKQEETTQTQHQQCDVRATEKPLTQRQKLARTFAAYGSTAVVFHTAISLTSLGTCYLAVSRYVSTANNL